MYYIFKASHELKEDLNKIGSFKIQLDLFSEVSAKLIIEINK